MRKCTPNTHLCTCENLIYLLMCGIDRTTRLVEISLFKSLKTVTLPVMLDFVQGLYSIVSPSFRLSTWLCVGQLCSKWHLALCSECAFSFMFRMGRENLTNRTRVSKSCVCLSNKSKKIFIDKKSY